MNSHPKCETLNDSKDAYTEEEKALPHRACTTGDINITQTREPFQQNHNDAL